MFVRHLTIGGLRAYAPAPTTVPLSPLTLVFGPNSAGKSSLLSVLPLLRQSAARPHMLTMAGEILDAGSFRLAVHRHDESQPITLGLAWTGADGADREVSAVYHWDPVTRAAVRTRLNVDDGSGMTHVAGLRPWGDQPGAATARRVGPELFEVLEKVAFLGPMRARPERTTSVGHGAAGYVGPAGEDMAELMSDSPELVAAVNEWCDRMGLGYRVRILTPVSRDVIITTGDFAVVALEDVRHDPPVLVSPRAVGFGVGQLLPVITQCLVSNGGAILVEQPEVHLHPRLQSATADLFIDTVNSGRGQLLVETHSEHLVLRLLRRIREGVISPDLVSLLYVDLHDDGAAFVRRLEIDDDGEIVDGWPGGFFDDRLAEVLPGFDTSPLVTAPSTPVADVALAGAKGDDRG